MSHLFYPYGPHAERRPILVLLLLLIFGFIGISPACAEWRLNGLPFGNFTADKGIGYGVYVAALDRAPKNNPPYTLSIGGQYYETTGGYAFHKFMVDYPSSIARFTLTSGWENWGTAPYFGDGAQSVREIQREDSWYTVDLGSLWLQPQVRLPVSDDWQVFIQNTFRHAFVQQDDNLLAREKPTGFEGGRYVAWTLGLMHDTRNAEPTPSRGYWSEVSVTMASPYSGSEFTSFATNITHRHWWSLSQQGRWVLASRTAADHQSRTPFFQKSALSGSQWLELGGHSLLRGLETGRLRGAFKLIQTIELHRRGQKFSLWSRSLVPMIVFMTDFAIIGEDPKEALQTNAISGSMGLGTRLEIDGGFVLRFDGGFAPEKVVDETGQSTWRLRKGVYFIIGHSF